MFLIRRTLALIVAFTMLPAGAAVAQTRIASATPILDAGRRHVKQMAASTGRRHQGIGADPRMAAGFALGAMLGGYAGLYVAARNCHCESDRGVVVGMLAGGAAGVWIAHKLSHP